MCLVFDGRPFVFRCTHSVTFTADDVGDHSYYCEPHKDSGMDDYHIVVAGVC